MVKEERIPGGLVVKKEKMGNSLSNGVLMLSGRELLRATATLVATLVQQLSRGKTLASRGSRGRRSTGPTPLLTLSLVPRNICLSRTNLKGNQTQKETISVSSFLVFCMH